MTTAARPSRRLLGLDVGERRIGVAVSEGGIAVPLTIIEHRDRATDLARIVETARAEHASAIVVGLPLQPSGDEGEQARLTRRFGDQLAAEVDVPVVYHDESMSSVDAVAAAGRRTKRSGGKRTKVHIDDLAAAVILQRYLDSQDGRS